MALMRRPEHTVTLDLADIPDGAFSVDGQHRIVTWNAAAERLFDCPAADALGRRCGAVMANRLSAACLGCVHWCGGPAQRAPQPRSIVLHRGGWAARLSISLLAAHTAKGELRVLHLLHTLPVAQPGLVLSPVWCV